mmetsp:Transcript_48623/g.56090  ORF Transcript_48623/g.56090 Transcript_48623/m.56090 type:complete len:480 (-) Transcript_48623:150-1589(-)
MSTVGIKNEPSGTTSVGTTSVDNDDGEKLEELVDYFMTANNFVYSFTILRHLVRWHDPEVDDRRKCKLDGVMVKKEDHCDQGPDCDKKEEELISSKSYEQIEFNRPELIITDAGSIKKMTGMRNLKYPVTPAAIKVFLDENRKYFVEANDGYGALEFNTNWRDFGKPLPGWFGYTNENEDDKKELIVQSYAKEQMKTDQLILEYDDTFQEEDGGGLVHGLILNKTKNWLCVVFRGSIGSKDWDANFDYNLSDIGEYGEGALIHQGFGSYLFGERGCDVKNNQKRTYVERIIDSINYAYENNPDVTSDCKLYITGHSLGAALASALAFHLAYLKKKDDKSVRNFPTKTRVVTFAAPLVGNEKYNTQYEHLEKNGFLRHIRMTNIGDAVPCKITLFGLEKIVIKGDPSKFVQNGLNLMLSSNGKTDIKYDNTNTLLSQLGFRSRAIHQLPVYNSYWCSHYNDELRQLTVKEAYARGGVVIN